MPQCYHRDARDVGAGTSDDCLGESWSLQRHAKAHHLHHCGNLRTLRWVIVRVKRNLDVGRVGDAILCQICGMLESAAKDSCSECPAPTPVQTSPPKLQQSSHGTGMRLRSRQQSTKDGVGRCSSSVLDKTSLRCRRAKAQKPKQADGSSRDIKVSRETEFTKFVSEEIAPARYRHTCRWRRIPMPASARRRARCNRHNARVRIVALASCSLVRLSTGGLGSLREIVSLPACTQRTIRRCAALTSRLDPVAFSGDKRGLSKALFLAVLNETSSLIRLT